MPQFSHCRITFNAAIINLLRWEFEERGCKLKALNDRGDESPEGELTDGILDQDAVPNLQTQA